MRQKWKLFEGDIWFKTSQSECPTISQTWWWCDVLGLMYSLTTYVPNGTMNFAYWQKTLKDKQ